MKKDGTRFTIRFNPVDPRQLRAMNALEAAGRRKSTLIADAVCEYLERRGENVEAFAPPAVIAPMPKNEAPKNDLPSPVPVLIATNTEKADIASDSVDAKPFNDEMHEAILEGLAAFDL